MKYLFFLIPALLVLALATNTEVFAVPVKITDERNSEVWDLYGNATKVYVGGGPTHRTVFNNATIYADGDNTWIDHDLDDLGDGDFDVLSGLIGTKFIGSTITHYNIETGIDVGTEQLDLRRWNGSAWINEPLTFVNRTHTTGIIAENYNVAGVAVTDNKNTITITENWTSTNIDVVIEYFFDAGKPLKHTFTSTRTTAGTDTYELWHTFSIFEEEIEIESEGISTSDVSQIKLKVKTDDIKLKLKFVNGTEIENESETTLAITKTIFNEILRVMEFKTQTNQLILGEIVAPSTTDPAWNDFIELFIDATSDPTFTFRYGNWTVSQGESFQLDPDSYTSDDPAPDGYIQSATQQISTCPTGVSSKSTTGTQLIMRADVDTSPQSCWRIFAQYDTTSITDGADVTDSHFKYEVTISQNPRTGCDFTAMTVEPDTATTQAIYDNIIDANVMVDATSDCDTVGTNVDTDLTAAGDTEIELALSTRDWFAIGGLLDDESRESIGHRVDLKSEEGASPTPKPTLEITFTEQPIFIVTNLDVYESSTRALDDGTAICLTVDLTSASACGGAPLFHGRTYQFQFTVTNTGPIAGAPTILEMRDMLNAEDVLGTNVIGNFDTGCNDDGTDRIWTDSIVGDDIRGTAGTVCTIEATSGSEIYYVIATLERNFELPVSDANNGAGTFFVEDTTACTGFLCKDESTSTTFTVDIPFTPDPVLLDVYESGTRALDDGSAECTNIDLTTADTCLGTLTRGNTYQFQVNVTNIGDEAGTPSIEEFRNVVSTGDVLGSMLVTALDTGCNDDGTDRQWGDSVVTDDAVGTSGIKCTIEANTGWEIYYWIVTIDTDAGDGSGTFFFTNGTAEHDGESTVTTFDVLAPIYTIDALDVYESSSRAIDDGTPICLNVDLTTPSTCGTALDAVTATYQFQFNVTNSGDVAGTPSQIQFRDVVFGSDVLGTITTADLDSGCDDEGTDRTWTDSISSDDAVGTAGTTCSIGVSDTDVFYFIATLPSDAGDGTGLFFITDAALADESTLTTFTVNSAIDYTITDLDVYLSDTRALDDGTAVCTNVDLTSASSCVGDLDTRRTYQFQVNVTNSGDQTGAISSSEFRNVVGTNGVLGRIVVGDLDTGCNDDGADRAWTDSLVSDDAVGTSGTTCSLPTNDWDIFYFIVQIGTDANNGTGTFFITDGTIIDVSTLTTFTIIGRNPDAVSDLVTSNSTFQTIDLTWTEPFLNSGAIDGYQINSTTPFGNPLTLLQNTTSSSGTSFTVTGLTIGRDYSFRIGTWTDIGFNGAGNVGNGTTLGSSFTVGQVAINQTNPDILDIRYIRTDTNSTSTRIDVLYANTYNLTCTVDHKFARTSINYSNLDIVAFDSSTSNSSFIFTNHTNDIINMLCFNENDTTQDARFQVIWSAFPLLDQFANFRSGEYGTDGVIGSIDFITLAVIIFSMIGLNRVNESVGVIFNIALLGALAYFGIIELPTIIFGALVVVLIFTVASTRKQ